MKPVLLYEQVGERVIETDDLPRIIDPNMIIDREGTILDPTIMREGHWLELGYRVTDYVGKDITRIYVPPIHPLEDHGMWIVHPVMWVANQITRVLGQLQVQQTTYGALQKMVNHYQAIAERELNGKSGLIRNVVVGARMKKSGRAVLVPNGSYEPDEVGIPGKFFEDMGISHHDFVVIGRNPTIWTGSIEIVRARRNSEDTVELHPLLFKQLGGDCDGDDIWFLPVPKTPDCQTEAKEQLLHFCIKNGVWTRQALTQDEYDVAPVNWETIKEETRNRFRITGASVGPADILDENQRVTRIEQQTGKQLTEACERIATGLPWKSVRTILSEKNFETLRMKKHLGLVGIACNRLKMLAGRVPAWVESANYMSERLQQILLDAKHLSGSYSVFDVLAILNKTGEWRNCKFKKAYQGLATIEGLDIERCRPILLAIYIAYPWMIAVDDLLNADKKRGSFFSIIRKLGHGTIPARMVMKSLERHLRKEGYESYIARARALAVQYSTGLTEMALRFYPLHELIAARNPDRGLTKRVLHHRDVDANGPCRQAWDIWHEKAGVK